MKIQIASDLHTEFIRPKEQEKFCRKLQSNANIIVLAGYVSSHHRTIEV
jgi:hypothetical protein